MTKKSIFLLVGISIFVVIPATYAQRRGVINNETNHQPVRDSRTHHLKQSNQHSYFEENKGQVSGGDAQNVLYTFNSGDLSIFLLKTGLAYQFTQIHQSEGAKLLQKSSLSNDTRLETYRMNVDLAGANVAAAVIAEGKSTDYCNYYQSNTLNVHNYSKVTYREIYPNIDWVIYKSGNTIKYDFIVRPGGDPKQIKLRTQYVEKLQSNSDGSYTMLNRMGTVTEHKPISSQQSREVKTEIKIDGSDISFNVGHYDLTQDLIIDPELGWSTYYGGVGADNGHSVAVDKIGNVYLAGYTQSPNNIADGGYQNSFVFQNGPLNFNNFLVKFNKDGVRQWATYYGAVANTADYKASCATDLWGNIYLSSSTSQTTGIAQNGHQSAFGGAFFDAYLVKFDSLGNRLWGTYYGGEGNDVAYGCATDLNGSVYLCGATTSEHNISFNGYKNTYGGDGDPFLVKFNKDGERLWATYYGGTGSDIAYGCAVDGTGSVYLTGNASSRNGIAFQGHQSDYGGAFLVKFNSEGARQWGTYYGSRYNDQGNACATDGTGAVYMAGTTSSPSNIAYNGFQNTYGGGGDDAFLVKFNSSGVRQWGTYYGGDGHTIWQSESGRSCSISSNGAVYLAGNSSSHNGIGQSGYQDTFGGGPADAFLVKFNSQTGDRIWGSYFGGEGGEFGFECASDESTGSVYLCGMTKTQSGLISGGHQVTFGGAYDDAFLVKLQDECLPDSNSAATLVATPSTPTVTGTSVVFNLVLQNQGLFPVVKWYKNNVLLPSVSSLSWTGISGVDFQNSDEISVKVFNNSFCANIDSAMSNAIKMEVPVGIGNIKAPDNFSIYPNPSNQYVTFGGLRKADHIDVRNAIGQRIDEITVLSDDRLFLDLSKYAPGIYLFTFTRKPEQQWSAKVIRTNK